MTEQNAHQEIRVAIIEDDPSALERLRNGLSRDQNIKITSVARNAADGLEIIKLGNFDVLLCDLGLPDGSGINLIRELSRRSPEVEVIVVTVFADQAKVIDSIKAGARGYILKDENLEECAERILEIRNGGSPISPVIARQLLKMFQPPRRIASSHSRNLENLTPRELEALQLLSRGFSNKEIADILSVSYPTVATFVKSIYRKLEVTSRSEAVYEATTLGLISMNNSL